jgi:hypothetical protein
MASFFSFALLSSLALAGCSGQIVAIGEIDQPVTPGPGGPGIPPIPPGGGDGFEIPECAEPTGATNAYTSIADTEAKIAGAWFLCSGKIHSPGDTKGIEIESGAAHFLVVNGTTLTRGGTADHDRSVAILDTTSMNGPGAYQINLSTPSGFNMYTSRSSQDGRFLELNEGTSGQRARYVRATRRTGPSCDTPLGTPHVYTSIADVSTRLQGTWRVCTGGINWPQDTKGLELAASTAHFLVDAPSGLARKGSWDYERSVTILDVTAMNGPGSYQINLSASGTNMYFSRVSESGARLELDEGTSGRKVSLVRVK